ncbi:MAG: hypothetical protein JWN73_4410 [Betaproteobacteria bacterium]|nr:hypothetical protein [Betaproteobacteria bacterium]
MAALPDEDAPYAAWKKGDVRTAFRLFLAHARAGGRGHEINIGYFYDVGLGTRKNRGEVMRWYRLDYRRGSSGAASNIAMIYRDEGRHAMEVAWYQRAAALDDGDAEVEIAKYYLSGLGAPKHRGRAIAALKRAVKSRHITPDGREEAARILADCRKPGTPEK